MGDHALGRIADTSALLLLACDAGFDPIENRLRANIRRTIEAACNEELDSLPGHVRVTSQYVV